MVGNTMVSYMLLPVGCVLASIKLTSTSVCREKRSPREVVMCNTISLPRILQKRNLSSS